MVTSLSELCARVNAVTSLVVQVDRRQVADRREDGARRPTRRRRQPRTRSARYAIGRHPQGDGRLASAFSVRRRHASRGRRIHGDRSSNRFGLARSRNGCGTAARVTPLRVFRSDHARISTSGSRRVVSRRGPGGPGGRRADRRSRRRTTPEVHSVVIAYSPTASVSSPSSGRLSSSAAAGSRLFTLWTSRRSRR